MQVTVLRVPRPNRVQAVELPDRSTVLDALHTLGAYPDQVIVLRDERPVPVDAPLRHGDALRVVNVFSGG